MARPHPALLLSLLIDSLGSGMFGPMILLYFHLVAGLPLAQVGALASAAAVLGLVVPLFTGPLADRLSPRTLVVTGQIVQALGYLLFLTARGPVPVFVAFVLTAAGLRVFWSTFFTMMAALPLPLPGPGPGEQGGRERLFAVIGTVRAVGFGTGALIGGLLVGSASPTVFRAALIGNAVSFLVAAVLLVRVPMAPRIWDSTAPRPSGVRILVRDRPFLALVVVDACFAICSDALLVGLPIAVKEGRIAPVAVLGPVLAANTFVIALAQLTVAKSVRGLSRVQALALAGLLWAVWATLMTALPAGPAVVSGVLLAALVLIWTLAEMIHAPVANALATDAAPPGHRGLYLATFQYGFAVANIVVPGAFTALFALGHDVPWIALAVLATAAACGAVTVGRFLPAAAVRPGGRAPQRHF
ncbi:MFS transporter [Kineosporia sp. J2-2]|uniref:MFS transporter n=1 Tax=Kineosporia corallincola TaxID=2835133 RepID=A0ABS5TCB3_9ACTN|nr:MFS transporter [Kineosporia corallincola]MBT0768488.1 MFS transporter [Kineosporia corallincola]